MASNVIKSYLENGENFHVVSGDERPDTTESHTGVPQDSVSRAVLLIL